MSSKNVGMQIDQEPQFFIDDHIVDNRWGVEWLTETVTRVFHTPVKHEANPLVAGKGGHINVVRDEEADLYRMWYTDYWDQSFEPRLYTYAIAYAESKDGVDWHLPHIGKHEFKGTKDNNIVLLGPTGGRAEAAFVLDLPDDMRRGYKYVAVYMTDDPKSTRLIGSQDGITWERDSDMSIATGFTPDAHHSIVWDPKIERFVWFTRATNIYRNRGERRKLARLEHTSLWEEWPIRTENVLLPDQVDAQTLHNYFYSMPTRYHAGIYWGFLWSYRHQEDIFVSLAFSRDGRNFQRPADRPALISPGDEGDWDGGMVTASGWVEVGDEWWIYFSGTDGRHKEREPVPGIGLARMRKEGFASLRSPAGGGFIVTKTFICPGDRLFVNVDATQGELSVRVTDYERQALPGFEANGLPLSGDHVRHEVTWNDRQLETLRGQEIRLEFEMKGVVDLYSFCFTTQP
jgi:hypothetical protein